MYNRPGSNVRKALLLIVLFFGALFVFGAANLLTVHAQTDGNPYYKSRVFKSNGQEITQSIISGPPHPVPGVMVQPAAVQLPLPGQYSAIHSLVVPAYNWVFGCSSVSGSMIAAYYDRNGYPAMYTGPTNGGVMPLDNSAWGTWSDGTDTYPNIPLAASHMGVDGRATKGSIDDYWILYGSAAADPFITGSWTQHTPGTAIGDYMKTSQSTFGNTDGSSSFFNYTTSGSQLTCAAMETMSDGAGHTISYSDATYGRKLFYQARGYTVTTCYSQNTDRVAGGFTLAQFKAEINAGRPVMINLAGHTIVGVGYDDTSTTIYVNDTWDYSSHAMTWNGTYSAQNLQMLSVSIVNLAPVVVGGHKVYIPLVNKAVPLPGAFNKSLPANGATAQPLSPTLTWTASTDAASYQYCVDTTANNSCDGNNWQLASGTSATVAPLTANTTYYWQVMARNAGGLTDAAGGWWSFTTGSGAVVGCGLVNCDFELGSGHGWNEYSYQGWYPVVLPASALSAVSVTPRSGNYAAWLGGADDEITYISQQVTISANAPYLVYHQWIGSNESTCTYDIGGVLINHVVVDYYGLCGSTNTGGWATHSVNLSAYVGQSVLLEIRVETDSSVNSNMFVDDVALSNSPSAPAQNADGAKLFTAGANVSKSTVLHTSGRSRGAELTRYFIAAIK
jgi:hypothetical protein